MSECNPLYEAVFQISGNQNLASPSGLRSIEWARRLDDVSRARLVYVKRGQSEICCQQSGRITPWRDTVSIVRDGRIVWFGTVLTVEESRDEIVIEAADPLIWLTRRIIRTDFNFIQTDLTDIARRLINDSMSYADAWSALDVNVQYQPSGTLSDLLVESDRFPRYIWNVLNEKLASGLDSVVVAKTVYFGSAPPAADIFLKATDFQGDLSIRKDGNVYASSVYVNANDDVRAQYPASPAPNPLLVEMIISDAQIQTVQAAENTAKARWAYAGQQGVPVIVQASDNLTLNQSSTVKLPQLVPGAQCVLDANDYCFGRVQRFRLGRVDVSVSAGVEQIQIALQPTGPQELSEV